MIFKKIISCFCVILLLLSLSSCGVTYSEVKQNEWNKHNETKEAIERQVKENIQFDFDTDDLKPEYFHPEDTPKRDNLVPENAAENACGDNLTWRVDEKMTLYIEGEGKMWDFVTYNEETKAYYAVAAPWANTDFLFVIFGDGITHIGDNAFARQKLWYVNIPDSVKSIGAHAFAATGSVISITLGNGVKTIGEGAFYGSSAESLSLASSLQQAADDAFIGCNELDHITFRGTESEWEELNGKTNALSRLPASKNDELVLVFE